MVSSLEEIEVIPFQLSGIKDANLMPRAEFCTNLKTTTMKYLSHLFWIRDMGPLRLAYTYSENNNFY